MKSSYDNMDDVRRMQEEAIRRVQQMQQRAKKSLELASFTQQEINKTNIENDTKCNCEEKETNPDVNTSQVSVTKIANEPTSKNILDALMKDNERSLLLVLILLLMDEKCDTSLILALMYLVIN